MKRILRITNFTQSLGGGEKYVITLSKNLNDLGYENIIVCQKGDFSSLAEKNGIKVFNINLCKDSLAVYKLSRFILTNKIDIIHTHGYYGDKRGLIAAALTRSKATFTSILSFLNIDDHAKPKKNFPLWFRNQLLKYIPHKIIAVSQATKENIIQNARLNPTRVEVILDGIDLKRTEETDNELVNSTKQELNVKNPVIAIISRLQPEKGHSYLFKALPLCLEKYPTLQLLVVGSGYAEKEYRSQVVQLNLSNNVIFTGVYSHKKVLALLKIVDFTVLPSLIETCGLINLEALSMGTPVISTRVGGIPEYIKHNQTGILVEPRNPSQLAQAICLLLDNPDIRERLGQAGQKSIFENFSAFRHAESVANLYEQILCSST